MTQLNHFSLDVQYQLKNYVYALVDPRPNQERHQQGTVFYVGRGSGNRVFSHEREAAKGQANGEYAKLQRIQEIEQTGYHVKRLIISWGLTFDEAMAVEGALIDFFRLLHDQQYGSEPTNITPGYHNDDQDQHRLRYETVEEINARLSMPTVSLKELRDQHIGLITLGRPDDPQDLPNDKLLGSAAFNSQAVIRRSLGNWVLKAGDEQKIKYLLVVTHGDYVIVGAFKIVREGHFTVPQNKYERRRIYWRDSAIDKDPAHISNQYIQPITEIGGVTVGPNVKLGDVWFNAQQSGLNVVDNK